MNKEHWYWRNLVIGLYYPQTLDYLNAMMSEPEWVKPEVALAGAEVLVIAQEVLDE